MKRSLMSFMCPCLYARLLSITAAAVPEWPSDVFIQADAGIIMNSDTGMVLYGENMDQPYYPVSITKILTVLIVLERCDLDEMVTPSHDDVYNVEARSNSAGTDEGGVLTVRDCLYALVLASTNESVNTLACHVNGSRETLAQLMSEKTRNLGYAGSHFNNLSGLDDENHYTTAHDVALIARVAIQNPEFLTINGTRSYQLTPAKRTPEEDYVANHHKMLNKNETIYYPGVFTGKTGYTSLTGNTLVTCTRKNNATLIAVVLNGHQSHYSDTKALFDFGFRNSQSLRTVDCETRYKSLENGMTIVSMTSDDSIPLGLDRSDRVVIPGNADFIGTQSALIYNLDGSHPQAAIACISYTYNDRPMGSVYLCSPDLERSTTFLASQDASGASAVSMGQGGEMDNPASSDSSDHPDTPGLQDTPKAPSNAETPRGQTPAPTPAPRRDITSKEGTAASIRIPTNTLAILGITFSLAVVIAIMAAMKVHVHRKEKGNLYLRRQRRLERLEDIGFSSSDFEKLVTQRRVSSPPLGEKGKKGRGRKHKKSLFR